jgi:hypothetical protein
MGALFQPLVFGFAAINVLAWYVCVAVGARIRGSRTVTDEEKLSHLVSGLAGGLAFFAFSLLAGG